MPNVDGGLITALDKYLVKTVGSNLADTLLRIQILLNGVDLPESAKVGYREGLIPLCLRNQ